MMRRLLSIVLTATLLTATLPLSVLASEEKGTFSSQEIQSLLVEDSSALNSDIENQIQKELTSLREIGLLDPNIGSLESIHIDSTVPYEGASATVSYSIDYGNVTETIVFTRLDSSNVGFIARNAASHIENNLLMEADGDIFLDDSLITVSSINEPMQSTSRDGTSPARVSDRVYQNSCPYGVGSDYTKSAGQSKTSNIDMKNFIKDVVYSVAFTIVSSFLFSGLVTACFTSALWSVLQNKAPTSRGLSCIDNKYWHKSCGALSGGHISGYGKYVTQHKLTWYPQTSFKGSPSYSTTYEIHTIY